MFARNRSVMIRALAFVHRCSWLGDLLGRKRWAGLQPVVSGPCFGLTRHICHVRLDVNFVVLGNPKVRTSTKWLLCLFVFSFALLLVHPDFDPSDVGCIRVQNLHLNSHCCDRSHASVVRSGGLPTITQQASSDQALPQLGPQSRQTNPTFSSLSVLKI
jgi:hypothetical protein